MQGALQAHFYFLQRNFVRSNPRARFPVELSSFPQFKAVSRIQVMPFPIETYLIFNFAKTQKEVIDSGGPHVMNYAHTVRHM